MRYKRDDVQPLNQTTKLRILAKCKRLKLNVKQAVHAIGVTRDTYYRMMQDPLEYRSGVGPGVLAKVRVWLEKED